MYILLATPPLKENPHMLWVQYYIVGYLIWTNFNYELVWYKNTQWRKGIRKHIIHFLWHLPNYNEGCVKEGQAVD